MNITVEKQPKSEVKVIIELTPEETEKHLNKAAEQISGMVKVPGFRPGHVPLEVLKKHVKEDAIESQMLDLAIPESYTQAVKKEDLQVISRPNIKIVQNNPLKYEATVAIYPEVKVAGYDKIKIKKETPKVEDKDVEEVLADIQKRHATYKEVDREAKKGDKVEIDFEGFDEGGASLENTQSKNHPLVIGEETLVKGFEDELIGLKKGDEKEFSVKFPKDYFHKPFQDKTVKFKVKLNRVDETNLPELNPEFIKQVVGEEKSLEDLKKDIKENMGKDKDYQEKVRRENEFLEQLAGKTEVEIPNALIEEEIDGMIEEFTNELSGKGITLEQYLEGAKKELKDLREIRKKEAEKRLKLRFGLHQLFDQEKIEATEEELNKEMEHVKSLYPENEREKLVKEFADGGYLMRRLENKIKMEKLFERYLTE